MKNLASKQAAHRWCLGLILFGINSFYGALAACGNFSFEGGLQVTPPTPSANDTVLLSYDVLWTAPLDLPGSIGHSWRRKDIIDVFEGSDLSVGRAQQIHKPSVPSGTTVHAEVDLGVLPPGNYSIRVSLNFVSRRHIPLGARRECDFDPEDNQKILNITVAP